AHRLALVDENVYAHVLFFDELPQHQPLQSRIDVPVNVAKIVAGFVLAKVCELDRRAAPGRAPFAAHRPRKSAPRLDAQSLQLSQKGGIEQAVFFLAHGSNLQPMIQARDGSASRGRDVLRVAAIAFSRSSSISSV